MGGIPLQLSLYEVLHALAYSALLCLLKPVSLLLAQSMSCDILQNRSLMLLNFCRLYVMLVRALPCLVLPCPALPCPFLPCSALLCSAHAVPGCAMLCSALLSPVPLVERVYMQTWLELASSYVKSIDSNHLVYTGLSGLFGTSTPQL